jgi:hypothetical protein
MKFCSDLSLGVLLIEKICSFSDFDMLNMIVTLHLHLLKVKEIGIKTYYGVVTLYVKSFVPPPWGY